jgi:hypothetical protein
MRTLTIILMVFSFSTGFSQANPPLNATEKRQAEIHAEAILIAKKWEKLADATADALKPEKTIKKGDIDTIISVINYEVVNNKDYRKNPTYKNLQQISMEAKDGLLLAKFRADLLKDIKEDSIIRNYKKVKGAGKTIAKGDNKLLVYVTPGVEGTFLNTTKWGWSVGLLTVPFKIRPATSDVGAANSTGRTPSESKADIKNIQIFFGRNRFTERLFWNNRTSSHRWLFGAMVGISSEELTNVNTKNLNFEDNPTNQAYLTLAGGVGYSYKDKITIMFIPVGSDIGFSDTSKQWIYNGNYWWGFGIGVDLSSVFHF